MIEIGISFFEMIKFINLIVTPFKVCTIPPIGKKPPAAPSYIPFFVNSHIRFIHSRAETARQNLYSAPLDLLTVASSYRHSVPLAQRSLKAARPGLLDTYRRLEE